MEPSSRVANLSGKKIDRLSILEYIGQKHSSIWKCLCDCGKEVTRTLEYLKSKRIKIHSCGCGSQTRIKKDHTGLKYGTMIVLKSAGGEKWLCKCEVCGLTNTIYRSNLRRIPNECKCIKRKEHLSELVLNKRFGKLIVDSYYGKGDKANLWRCRCDCGRNCIVKSCDLLSNRTTTCGCGKSDNYLDIKGKTFNKIHVIRRLGSSKNGGCLWLCKWTDCHHEFKEVTTRIVNKKRRICIPCKKRPWTIDEINIIKRYAGKENIKFIATKLINRSVEAVKQVCVNNKISFNSRKKVLDEKVYEAVGLKNQGFDVPEISKMMRLSGGSIQRYLRLSKEYSKKELELTKKLLREERELVNK